jgi:2-hydroxychromene-2-carboxylate isomerase
MPSPLRFYFDYISPYAYLAWTQVHAVAARHDREVEPVPVLLAGLLEAMDTRGPAEIPAKRAYVIKDVARLAHGLGVPLDAPPAHPFNPLYALRVSSLPMAPPMRRALVDGLYAAVWAGGGGVTERERVAEVAKAVGLAETALAEAESAPGKERVRRQTEEALQAGAFGVPTMVVDGELFFGLDSLPHLERWLRGEDPLDPALLERWARLPAQAVRKPPPPVRR